MNTKVVTIAAAILLAGLAYYVVTNNQAPADQAQGPQTGTVSQNNPDGRDANTYDPVMVGTWKSTDDAKFTRSFSADGTVTDAYAGDASATETGTYTIVNPLQEPAGAFGAATAESLTGMTVIKATFPKSGVMYFGVQSESETNLSLIYIGRGNVLSFTKVQ